MEPAKVLSQEKAKIKKMEKFIDERVRTYA
jgi:hypothetical protein